MLTEEELLKILPGVGRWTEWRLLQSWKQGPNSPLGPRAVTFVSNLSSSTLFPCQSPCRSRCF